MKAKLIFNEYFVESRKNLPRWRNGSVHDGCTGNLGFNSLVGPYICVT